MRLPFIIITLSMTLTISAQNTGSNATAAELNSIKQTLSDDLKDTKPLLVFNRYLRSDSDNKYHLLKIAESDQDWALENKAGYYMFRALEESMPEKALKWLKLQADHGDAESMFYLGMQYSHHTNFDNDYRLKRLKIPNDKELHLTYLEKAHNNGYNAVEQLIGAYEHYEMPDQVVKWLKEEALTSDARGKGHAFFELYEHYLEGNGVAQSNKTAIKYLRQAANHWSTDAYFVYGKVLYEGLYDVSQDKSEGIKYLKKAADEYACDAIKYLVKIGERSNSGTCS